MSFLNGIDMIKETINAIEWNDVVTPGKRTKVDNILDKDNPIEQWGYFDEHCFTTSEQTTQISHFVFQHYSTI